MSFVDPARSDAVLAVRGAVGAALGARAAVRCDGHARRGARRSCRRRRRSTGPSARSAELQGDYDGALSALSSPRSLKDPKDVATHFRLAVVLRRVRKFDDAAAELDKVAAVDKDYPGLALERGLLFEESGDVEKAIEQFKGALAKAPDDPDLQLRVGERVRGHRAAGRRAADAAQGAREARRRAPRRTTTSGRALMLKGALATRSTRSATSSGPSISTRTAPSSTSTSRGPRTTRSRAQLELARDEVDKALALDKLNAEAYWQRGVLERMEGAIEDAIKDEKPRAGAAAVALRGARDAGAVLRGQERRPRRPLAEWPKAIAGDGESPRRRRHACRHPFWRYRYGKLLCEHGRSGGGARAAPSGGGDGGEDCRSDPGWLAAARVPDSRGATQGRAKQGRASSTTSRFLDIAPVNSPDRADAKAALAQLAH